MNELPPQESNKEQEPQTPRWAEQFIAEGYIEEELEPNHPGLLIEEIWDRLEEFVQKVKSSGHPGTVFLSSLDEIVSIPNEMTQRERLIMFFVQSARENRRSFEAEVEQWYTAFLGKWEE